MATARSFVAGTGSQTAAFVVGGEDPALSNAVEEFTGAGTVETQTITVT